MRWGLALGTSPWAYWPSNNRFERNSFNNRSLWKPYLPLSLAPGTERRGKKKRSICKVLAKSQAQWIGKKFIWAFLYKSPKEKDTVHCWSTEHACIAAPSRSTIAAKEVEFTGGLTPIPLTSARVRQHASGFHVAAKPQLGSVPAGNRYSPVHVRNMHVWHQRKKLIAWFVSTNTCLRQAQDQ